MIMLANDNNLVMISVMEKLVTIRTKQFLTQRELAARAGVTVSTVNRLERRLQNPTFKTIKALAKALNVDPAEIIF